MLVIRKAQMKAMNKPQVEVFVKKLIEQLKGSFPVQCETFGDENLRKAVDYCLDRAEKLGFETEADLSAFTTLLFTFGRDFDAAPEYSWASCILNSKDSPEKKMEELVAKACEFEDQGKGLIPDLGIGAC